jgi:HAD superfamily hydrolase (TIGR01458 family)
MNKPILLDLDGVLRIKGEPAPDLPDFLNYLSESKISACILSNSTISTSRQIVDFFEENHINLTVPVITAVDAAKEYMINKYEKAAVFVSENVIGEFTDILDYDNPEAVLIGDIGDKWNYQLMQTIYDYVRRGAELIAAHKNKIWERSGKGLSLDAGPFIHAIEYACSISATLIGKPSSIYFQLALAKINADPGNPFFMLGDDIDSDIAGTKKLNATTILTYTGKTKAAPGNKYSKFIDFEVNNLIEVIELLKKEN